MKQIMTTAQIIKNFGFTATVIILTLIVGSLLFRPEQSVKAKTPSLAQWSSEPQVLGARRGNPWINVRDGEEIITDFAGAAELRTSFENANNQALSLAAADFDEDGTPDIIAGYTNNNSGAACGIATQIT